jgi:hypothetical protein
VPGTDCVGIASENAFNEEVNIREHCGQRIAPQKGFHPLKGARDILMGTGESHQQRLTFGSRDSSNSSKHALPAFRPPGAVERFHLRQPFKHSFRASGEWQELKPRLDLPCILPFVPRVFGIVSLFQPFVHPLHHNINVEHLAI